MKAIEAFFANFWAKFLHGFVVGLVLSVLASPSVGGLVSSGVFTLATLWHAVVVAAVSYLWGYLVKNAPGWFGAGSSSGTAGAARLGVLLALLAASPAILACPPAPANAASVTVMAVGDSAKITFHWPAVNKATGYTYTVSALASNGTWTGLPVNQATAATSGSAVGVSSTADTAVFQVCATAVGASGSSAIGCSSSTAGAANTWRRKLQPPAPVVDSVAIRPNPVTLQLASSRIACSFQGFDGGQMAERTADKPACDSIYRKSFTSAHRSPSAAEQAYADTATWQWSTSNPAAVGLVPLAFGSSAVTVQGNGLTMLLRVPLERYASAEPVARIDSTYLNPDGSAGAAVTCLRPGLFPLTATVGGVSGSFLLPCSIPYSPRLAADDVRAASSTA